MRIYKPWKHKTIEEKMNSAMYWFRLLILVSVAQGVLSIMKLLLLSAVGI